MCGLSWHQIVGYGLVAWLVVGLIVALIVGRLLREMNSANERVERW